VSDLAGFFAIPGLPRRGVLFRHDGPGSQIRRPITNVPAPTPARPRRPRRKSTPGIAA